ncbi:MAG: ATP-binding protein [Deltaproteobacteria bacterium]
MKIEQLKGEITVKWLAEDNESPLRYISICKKVEEYLNNEAARELNKRHSVAIRVHFKNKYIIRGEQNMGKEIFFISELDRMETEKTEGQLGIEEQWSLERKAFNVRNVFPELVHKLNNYLASVIGYAQLSLHRTTDAEVKNALGEIIKEAQRTSQIIRDGISLMRKERLRKEIQDINGLVEGVLDKKTAGLNLKNINVVKELSPSIPLTYVDPKQIQQVLLNLINNAEKAISEFRGVGEIRVKTRKVENQIEITISDNGPGIQEGDIFRIINPCTTTKEKGTGLGLAISYDILVEHGGTMRLESQWGKGATFIMTLPLTVLESKKREKGENVKRDLKGMKGLGIDDDLNIVNMISTYLEEQGCEISTATDMKMAISILEALTSIDEFDFIICDIKMPEVSGIDFYHIVEKKWPILKNRIIFSTGDILGDATRAFIASVLNPCIEKPFNLTDLKEVINKL